MTTKVIISSPKPNHLDVQIDVIGGDGAVRSSHHLTDGQSVDLWVFSNQQLRISEVAKAAKVTP